MAMKEPLRTLMRALRLSFLPLACLAMTGSATLEAQDRQKQPLPVGVTVIAPPEDDLPSGVHEPRRHIYKMRLKNVSASVMAIWFGGNGVGATEPVDLSRRRSLETF